MILKNLTAQNVSIRDLGELTVPASGQLDVGGYQLTIITNSDSLKEVINQDKLIINDGVRDLSKQESLNELTVQTHLEDYNPPDYEFMLQTNIVNCIFYTHNEKIYLKDNLKNAKVDFFKNQKSVESYSNIQFNGMACGLSLNSSGDQKDSFDSVANWSAGSGTTLTLETTIIHEGTGSGKFTIPDTVEADKTKNITRTFSPAQNYSTYSVLSAWIYGQGIGEEVTLVLIDSNSVNYKTDSVGLKSGWQRVDFNIAGLTRIDVKKLRFSVRKNVDSEVIVYFDDVRAILSSSPYQTSGYLITETKTVVADIASIYYSDFTDLPDSTSYASKISLDGGTTWHTLKASEQDEWIDITQWAEYASFLNLKNIKLRVDLATTDTAVTPQFDDYLIMWKLKIS